MRYSKHISLGYDEHGNRVRKRIYSDTKIELAVKEEELKREFKKKQNTNRFTFGQYLDKWERAYISTKAPSTQAVFKSVMKKTDTLRNKYMEDITKYDLQDIVRDTWNHPSVARLLCFRLKSIWESAVTDKVVQVNVASKLDKPRHITKKKRPLTKGELDAIKNAPFTEQERLLVDILMQFGLRPGEALALGSSSVDIKNRTLHITKNLAHNGEKPLLKKTKTEETRDLPIPDSMIPKFNKSQYYFTNEKGQLLTKWECQQLSESIIDKINTQMGGTPKNRMTDMTLYYFRHHKASLLYYLPGVSMKAKAAYMGHSEEMFIKTYSHMMEENENMEVFREPVL